MPEKIRNERGLNFGQMMRLMVNVPPPSDKQEAKAEAHERHVQRIAEERAKYEGTEDRPEESGE